MGLKLFVLPANERWIILAVILLVWLVIRGIQFFSARSKTSTPLGAHRDYGMSGGAICPKCRRPIRLSLMAIRLGLGTKLVRCEFCGKWSLVRRASLEELRAAEEAELADAQPSQPVHEKSGEEKLQDMVDQSRYIDNGIK